MADQLGGNSAVPARGNLGDAAFGLGLLSLVVMIIAMIVNGDGDEYGWMWFLMAALGLGALVAGLMSGRGRPVGRAMIGTVLGALTVILFLLFATGILS